MKFSKKIWWITLCLVVLLGMPFIAHSTSPITFNQFLIEKLQLIYGVRPLENTIDLVQSLYSSGLNIIFHTQPPPPPFDDPAGMFSYVFSYIPPHTIVYPTEQFYYFVTTLPSVGNIAGNIRVADLEKGEISMAYFKVDGEGGEDRSGAFHTFKLNNGNGVEIKKITDTAFDVSLAGHTIRFTFPSYVSEPPTIKTLPEEKFIGRIFDESGTGLYLFYNNKTNSFYEVLDEQRLTDTLVPLERGFIIGKRTGFIYFDDNQGDYKRKIIVAVNQHNALANNFLDGPQDQVPIHINFKAELTKAYPSIAVGPGTDDHGVVLGTTTWSRFALGPLGVYDTPKDIIDMKSDCLKTQAVDKSTFWTCLTKEYWNTPQWRQAMYDKLKTEGKYAGLKKEGLVVE